MPGQPRRLGIELDDPVFVTAASVRALLERHRPDVSGVRANQEEGQRHPVLLSRSRGKGVRERARGLWHSHVGWLFSTKGLERGPEYGKDLYDDAMVRWIDRLYLAWVGLTVGLPLLAGYAVFGTWQAGLQAMVWGGLIRIFLFQHVTFSINSVCHMFGTRPFQTRDESRNVWLLALPSFGESWHNGHHAFPASAVHGLERGQLDLSAAVIRGLEKARLAWDVKRPDPRQVERRRIATA